MKLKFILYLSLFFILLLICIYYKKYVHGVNNIEQFYIKDQNGWTVMIEPVLIEIDRPFKLVGIYDNLYLLEGSGNQRDISQKKIVGYEPLIINDSLLYNPERLPLRLVSEKDNATMDMHYMSQWYYFYKKGLYKEDSKNNQLKYKPRLLFQEHPVIKLDVFNIANEGIIKQVTGNVYIRKKGLANKFKVSNEEKINFNDVIEIDIKSFIKIEFQKYQLELYGKMAVQFEQSLEHDIRILNQNAFDTYISTLNYERMRLIVSALQAYKHDTGDFPSTKQGLQALLTNFNNIPNWHGQYIESEYLNDYWGYHFIYLKPGDTYKQDFDLLTLGKDNKKGGEQSNKDIIFLHSQ